MRATLKRAARALDERPWFRRPALAAVRALNGGTLRRLRREPAIADVFVKGSFVRGPFHPFASDVDLALVLRDGALADPVAGLASVFAALRAERRRNPSLRDWWQHLILESELPLVRRQWALFGADEWRSESGAPAVAGEGPADRTTLLLAQWAQQCLWSGSAVQAYLDPATPTHDFDAGLRKSAFFATRLELLDGLPEAPPDAAALFELRRRHALDFDAGWRRAGGELPARRAALVAMVRALERSARRLGGAAEEDDTLRLESDGALWLSLPRDADDAALAIRLDGLRRDGPRGGIVTWLVPAVARQLWPRPCAEAPFVADEAAQDVAFKRRLHLFETLFLASSLRLTLWFPDPERRVRRLFWTLARAALLYGRGAWCETRADVARELRDAGCGDAAADAGLAPLLDGNGALRRELPLRGLYAAGDALLRAIHRALAALPAGGVG
jgi:predicted nucleotidyltransferase